MRSIGWLLPLLAGACATQPNTPIAPEPADWTSGSRLQALVYSAGQSRLFKTWHDTKLGIDCAFLGADDGQRRCLPPRVEATSSFADSGCTRPIQLVTDGECPDSGYFVVEPVNPAVCLTKSLPLYKAGPTQAIDTVYAFDANGHCKLSVFSSVGRIGTAVDASAFVAAQPTVVPKGERLTLELLTAEDGSKQARSIGDSRRDTTCIARPGSAPVHCVPENLAGVQNTYGDATCSSPVAVVSSCGEPPNAIFRTPPSGSCSDASTTEKTLSEVGPSAPAAYDNFTGSCTPIDNSDGSLRFLEAGGPIAPSTLAKLDYVSEGGGGQVVARAIVAPSGERLRAQLFYDQLFETACTPQLADDGQLRCLPEIDGGSLYFIDAACTQPLATSLANCSAPAFAGTVAATATCGDSAYHLFRVGKKIEPATVYAAFSDGCSAAEMPPLDFYTLGAPIAASAFELVTLGPR